MKKRMIGNISVSEIGMGCMGFSHGYGKVPEEEYSIEAIRKAYEFGCTFFDTAEGYGNVVFYPGHNEKLLGKAIESFRKNVVLASKFRISSNEYGEKITLYDAIYNHLKNSMKNLRTNYIDLYYLHRIDENVPFENIAEVMRKLIKEGLIIGWGMSQVSVETLEKAHSVTPVTAVQNLYNILERDCEKDIFPFCIKNKIGVVPFSPIASGLLSGKITVNTQFEKVDDVRNLVPQLSKENIAANQPILNILSDFSQKKKATSAQVSLAWMLHKYQNLVPIPGSKNLERIYENLESCNVFLTDNEFKLLENELSKCIIHGHRGHIESTQNSLLGKANK